MRTYSQTPSAISNRKSKSKLRQTQEGKELLKLQAKQERDKLIAKDPDYFRKWEDFNRDKINLQKRQRRSTKEGRIASLYEKIRGRGYEFNLTKEWITDKINQGKCELTGIEFAYSDKIGRRNPYTPSIDRIDSNKGYTTDNCQMILAWLNVAKMDMPNELFKELILKAAEGIRHGIKSI